MYSQKKYSIPHKNAEILVDGKLDEAIWSELPEYSGFFNYLPVDEGKAKNQTSVKLFHNGESIFISAIYYDSVPKVQLGSLKRDDLRNSVASSDAFVLILDTQNQEQNAYYFAVNMGGAQTDGIIERISSGYDINISWNGVWKAKTSKEGTRKKYEIEIPFKALNFNKENAIFGVQFYVRDIKNNSWTILKNVKRNYRLFDLRFTEKFKVQELPDKSALRFSATPSFTINHQKDVSNDDSETTFKPSLDFQYNLNSSLKLDATINPDFSQIDVDQQVTNLTRFSVFLPERRNFFLEGADLFSNLGVEGVNPFYSRRVGERSDIQFGAKLSGNIDSKTRVGLLNVQTTEIDDEMPQNYGALVTERQLSNNFTATGFIINKQETNGVSFKDVYNRVTGINLNYKSNNNRWIGIANFGKSYTNDIVGKNSFYNTGIWYNKRGVFWKASAKHVGKNYITSVGFIPRLYNYDAENEVKIREGFTQFNTAVRLTKFSEKSKVMNSFRYLNFSNNTFLDENGKVTQSSSFYNTAVFFKNLSALYLSGYYDYVNLKYSFDPLRNNNFLNPDVYRYFRARLGYNSVRNSKLVYRGYVQHGNFYSGKNSTAFINLNYRLLPFANVQASYEINALDLNELGNEVFHLTRFTGEIFLSNRLNWTTYIQHNTQNDNFNINSRVQWEYKPLSYIYLVVTDNFDQKMQRTNWGVAFKMNYRFDF